MQMPKFGPVKHKDLIYFLKKFNYSGPFSGGRHLFMIKNKVRLVIPNPHKGDISKDLLSKILKQANISKSEWELVK
jgi:predicted RNA binding protein YcfA (HicA-like mRNA interferase family)